MAAQTGQSITANHQGGMHARPGPGQPGNPPHGRKYHGHGPGVERSSPRQKEGKGHLGNGTSKSLPMDQSGQTELD
eukprot:2167972-Rhodomonas_salina.1